LTGTSSGYYPVLCSGLGNYYEIRYCHNTKLSISFYFNLHKHKKHKINQEDQGLWAEHEISSNLLVSENESEQK